MAAVRARMTGSALRGACCNGGHHAGGGGTGSYGRFSTDFGSSGIEGQAGGLRYLLLAVDAEDDVNDEARSDISRETDRRVREEAVLGLLPCGFPMGNVYG